MNLREGFNLLRKGKRRMHGGKQEQGTTDRIVALVKNLSHNRKRLKGKLLT